MNVQKTPPPRYPWDRWFVKDRFKLVKGKDYRCTTISMAQQVRNAAVQYGLKVAIDEVEDGLLVTVEEK